MGSFLTREQDQHNEIIAALARLIDEMEKRVMRKCQWCGGMFLGHQTTK